MDSIEYIHYGCANFDIKKFNKVANVPESVKPSGGLWASRVNDEYGWKETMKDNQYMSNRLKESFTFRLKENANVLVIDNLDKIKGLPLADNKIVNMLWITLDFEKLSETYDAIEVLISSDGRLYDKLYGWDCDSILIMNPDVVVTE